MELGSTVPENEEEGGMDGWSDPSSGCCMPRTQHQRYLPKVQSYEPLVNKSWWRRGKSEAVPVSWK